MLTRPSCLLWAELFIRMITISPSPLGKAGGIPDPIL